jgi:hypothetical protein
MALPWASKMNSLGFVGGTVFRVKCLRAIAAGSFDHVYASSRLVFLVSGGGASMHFEVERYSVALHRGWPR